MIDLIVLIVGIIVFAITVYGTVMAAGLKLTKFKLEDQARLPDSVDAEELEKIVPQIRY